MNYFTGTCSCNFELKKKKKKSGIQQLMLCVLPIPGIPVPWYQEIVAAFLEVP